MKFWAMRWAACLAAVVLASCNHDRDDDGKKTVDEMPPVEKPAFDPSDVYRVKLTEVEKLQVRLEFNRKLQKKVSFELVDTELWDAINSINTLLKVGIVVDPAVLKSGDDKKHITFKAKDIEQGKALNEILRLADPKLMYVIKPPLFITFRTPQEADRLVSEVRIAKIVAYHIKNLKDSDSDIRAASCEMLAALGHADAIPALIEVLEPERKETELVRWRANDALVKLTQQVFEPGEYAKWKDWWENEPKPFRPAHDR